MRLIAAVVVVWLLIGVVAQLQRVSEALSANTWPHVGTVAVTVAAGPLNYAGVNPKVDCKVTVPQPSK